jgi:hypothetical protein
MRAERRSPTETGWAGVLVDAGIQKARRRRDEGEEELPGRSSSRIRHRGEGLKPSGKTTVDLVDDDCINFAGHNVV